MEEQRGQPPNIANVGGYNFIQNPVTGQWTPLPFQPQERRYLTPEQQLAESAAERALRQALAQGGYKQQMALAQYQNQQEMERLIYTWQQRLAEEAMQQAGRAGRGGGRGGGGRGGGWGGGGMNRLAEIRLQYELQRQLQEAQAAQQMAQMYAANPNKYWAQIHGLTPEAVARLTGGQIEAGEKFGHVPLSMPSMQWWANLLPSEQEQILGAVNWLGINPEDWMSTFQRMIPGLGSRQMEPMWAR